MELRDLDIGDIGWLIQRHVALYARSDGFDASFELLVRTSCWILPATGTPPQSAAGLRMTAPVDWDRSFAPVLRLTASTPVHNFGVDLIEQQWEIALL